MEVQSNGNRLKQEAWNEVDLLSEQHIRSDEEQVISQIKVKT